MKKSVSVLSCAVLLMCLMTGCGNSAKNDVTPGDTDVNRPGINDSVNDNNMDENWIGNDIDDGANDVGDAVDKGMDDMTEMVEDGVDKMTGNR